MEQSISAGPTDPPLVNPPSPSTASPALRPQGPLAFCTADGDGCPGFSCSASLSLEEFFTGARDVQLVLDPKQCIVLQCGRRLTKLGLRAGDRVTHVDGRPVSGSEQFKAEVCRLHAGEGRRDEQNGLRPDGIVMLTLWRVRVPGEMSPSAKSGSEDTSTQCSSTSSAGRTWKSMSSSNARQPNRMGLPSLALHDSKRREFDRQLLTMHPSGDSKGAENVSESPAGSPSESLAYTSGSSPGEGRSDATESVCVTMHDKQKSSAWRKRLRGVASALGTKCTSGR